MHCYPCFQGVVKALEDVIALFRVLEEASVRTTLHNLRCGTCCKSFGIGGAFSVMSTLSTVVVMSRPLWWDCTADSSGYVGAGLLTGAAYTSRACSCSKTVLLKS